MDFQEIEDLIVEEQFNTAGRFISDIPLDLYLEKIKKNAEIVSHYVGGKCAGFVAFYCNDADRKKAFITLVLVSNKYRGKGIANELIKKTLEICVARKFEVCGLDVLSSNESAIKIYKKNGFEEVSINKEIISMKAVLK